MNIANPFNRAYWIEYEHDAKVVPINRAHARANAAYSAQLLEEHRAEMRREIKTDLMRQRRELEQKIERIDSALMELAGG